MGHEKGCYNCDISGRRSWNKYTCCPVSYCDGGIEYPKFILRRDKRICENCGAGDGVCFRCPTGRLEGWKPKQEKQMQEYKPTSKCYLKQISVEIVDTNCADAKAIFFDVINKLYMSKGDIIGFKDSFYSTLKISDELYLEITKTEKRCNWLVEHGFIEENIKLLSCPVCKEYAGKVRSTGHVSCDKCGTLCASVKWWNTRK